MFQIFGTLSFVDESKIHYHKVVDSSSDVTVAITGEKAKS